MENEGLMIPNRGRLSSTDVLRVCRKRTGALVRSAAQRSDSLGERRAGDARSEAKCSSPVVILRGEAQRSRSG